MPTTSKCKYCGEDIAWGQNLNNGSNVPLEPKTQIVYLVDPRSLTGATLTVTPKAAYLRHDCQRQP